MSTLDYYNKHAQEFVEGTVNVDFTATQKRFLATLPNAGSRPLILDLGCGSGRDSKYFLDQGYKVEAVDGSPELCKLAEQLTGQPVKCLLFQDLEAIQHYDAIWACASLLHLPEEALKLVLKKCAIALKPRGIMYMSFKYGSYCGERNGRWFTDMTGESLTQLLKTTIPELQIIDSWISQDVRPGRAAEQWINMLVSRKQVK